MLKVYLLISVCMVQQRNQKKNYINILLSMEGTSRHTWGRTKITELFKNRSLTIDSKKLQLWLCYSFTQFLKKKIFFSNKEILISRTEKIYLKYIIIFYTTHEIFDCRQIGMNISIWHYYRIFTTLFMYD